MRSLQLKRMVSGVVAAIAVVAVLGVNTPAIADPDPLPDNASEALKEYRDLLKKAEKLNEAHLKAQDELAASEKELRTASADLKKAKRAEKAARQDQTEYRKVVDKFAGASYVGGHFSDISAALAGDSAHDFLERSAALDVLAAEKNAAMSKLAAAAEAAREAQALAVDAEGRAETSRDEAAKSKADIESRKRALDAEVRRSKEIYDRLSAADRAVHESGFGEQVVPPSTIKAPGPAAQRAVDAAMSQRGKPYSYGAAGPNSYDCSGLTSWAYRQAGISIPRSSSQQAQHGTPVSRDQLQPGDLVFFYQPVSHVGVWIGNGQMVHAPQPGDVVKVAPVMWKDYSGARRVS